MLRGNICELLCGLKMNDYKSKLNKSSHDHQMHVHDLSVNARHAIIDIQVHPPVVNIHGSGLNYKFRHLTLLAGCLPKAARPDPIQTRCGPLPGQDGQLETTRGMYGGVLQVNPRTTHGRDNLLRRLTETHFPAPGLIPQPQREWMCHMSRQPQPQPQPQPHCLIPQGSSQLQLLHTTHTTVLLFTWLKLLALRAINSTFSPLAARLSGMIYRHCSRKELTTKNTAVQQEHLCYVIPPTSDLT